MSNCWEGSSANANVGQQERCFANVNADGFTKTMACLIFSAHKGACQSLNADPVAAGQSIAEPKPWPRVARLPASNARFAARRWRPGTRLGCLLIGWSLAQSETHSLTAS